MNRSNVPYIVAAALLVLAMGGWGIFLTSDHGESASDAGPDAGADAEFDAAVDAGIDGGAAGTGAAGGLDASADATPITTDASITPEPPPVVPVPSMIPDTAFRLIEPPSSETSSEISSEISSEPDAGPDVPPAANDVSPADQPGAKPGDKKGAISPDAIKTVVSAMKPTMRVCYETLLDDFPDASGKVLVTFRVEAQSDEGMVTIIEVDEGTTLLDERLLDCLTDAFSDAEFPVPSGGETVQVTYPFTFTTK